MEQIAIPAWVLVMAVPLGVLGLLNLKAIFLWAYHQADLDTLRAKLWAEGLPRPIFTIALLFWLAVFLSLFVGLLHLIWTVLLVGFEEEAKEFRFLLAKITALTAVLGAVVALPFTVIRLRITAEQNRHAEDSLFNDKLNAAIADLHAQRQVTILEDGRRIDVWQDDVVRRNGAIDRLEALAKENTEFAQRIANMLSVYLKELTREYPAKTPPSDIDHDGLYSWYLFLDVARPDMEKAAQTMGRLQLLCGSKHEKLHIDLSGVNLQAFDLQSLNFQDADFSFSDASRAKFTATNLSKSRFTGACLRSSSFVVANMKSTTLGFTSLEDAEFTGADLTEAKFGSNKHLGSATFLHATTTRIGMNEIDLGNATLKQEQLEAMFGDTTVQIPQDLDRPAKWPNRDLEWAEFDAEYARYLTNPDAYIPPQDRDDAPSSP